jgi:transcriptional accessory protein Tex/SPT6
VSLRGAVSIARRLQDPLAELVRIEPKAIGVGQYQHDVSQARWRGNSTRSSRTASTPSAPT